VILSTKIGRFLLIMTLVGGKRFMEGIGEIKAMIGTTKK